MSTTEDINRLRDLFKYPSDPSHPEHAAATFINCPDPSTLLLVLLAARDVHHPVITTYIMKMGSCRPYYRCRLPVCPNCGKNPARRAAARIVRNMVDYLDDMDHVSYVTINCEVMNTIELVEIMKIRRDHRKKIQNLRRFKIPKTIWSAYFEVSASETPNLHIHSLVYHPRQTREQLRSLLREAYPDKRAVHVSEWKPFYCLKKKQQRLIIKNSIPLEDFNVSTVARYSTKHLPDVPYIGVGVDGDYKRIPLSGATKWIARWVIQTHLMKQDGLKCNGMKLGVPAHKERRWNRSTRVTRNERKEIVQREHFPVVALALGSRATTPERLAEFRSLPARPRYFDLEGGVIDVNDMVNEIMEVDSDDEGEDDYDGVEWEPADEFDILSDVLSADLMDYGDDWGPEDEREIAADVFRDPYYVDTNRTSLTETNDNAGMLVVPIREHGVSETKQQELAFKLILMPAPTGQLAKQRFFPTRYRPVARSPPRCLR